MATAEFRRVLADTLRDPARRAELLAADEPTACFGGTKLADHEIEALVAIVNHPVIAHERQGRQLGRFVPIALNLPDTCVALGRSLRSVLDAFWRAQPIALPHFLAESERFATFVESLDDGVVFEPVVLETIRREAADIRRRLSQPPRPPGPQGDAHVDPSSGMLVDGGASE